MKKLIANAALLVLAGTLGMSSLAHAETTGQYVDDSTITTKVKAALLADKQVKSLSIDVTTNQGTVQLTGNVPSKVQESEAIKVANRVAGVKSVDDDLTVGTTQAD